MTEQIVFYERMCPVIRVDNAVISHRHLSGSRSAQRKPFSIGWILGVDATHSTHESVGYPVMTVNHFPVADPLHLVQCDAVYHTAGMRIDEKESFRPFRLAEDEMLAVPCDPIDVIDPYGDSAYESTIFR